MGVEIHRILLTRNRRASIHLMDSPVMTSRGDYVPTADQRIVTYGVTWEQFEAQLALRGERSVPRIAYLEGALELMSPSKEHARIKSVHRPADRSVRARAWHRPVAVRRVDAQERAGEERAGAGRVLPRRRPGPRHAGPRHRGPVDQRRHRQTGDLPSPRSRRGVGLESVADQRARAARCRLRARGPQLAVPGSRRRSPGVVSRPPNGPSGRQGLPERAASIVCCPTESPQPVRCRAGGAGGRPPGLFRSR